MTLLERNDKKNGKMCTKTCKAYNRFYFPVAPNNLMSIDNQTKI